MPSGGRSATAGRTSIGMDAGGAAQVAQAGAPAASRARSRGSRRRLMFRRRHREESAHVGPWYVGAIQYVDETAKQVYFTARGREDGHFLYYAHLYRVGFDGTGLTLLTPEDANHDIEFSPSGKYFVDSYSRIEKPPVTVLRAVPDGHVDPQARGGRHQPRRRPPAGGRRRCSRVKARDGVTESYGVMYLPPKLDSTKKYPIIENIYPGPQVGSVGAWSFKNGGEPFSLAELGFVVIQLDHLGTPLRSKSFHDNYYGNFGDNGLPDHVGAIKQLAARYKFIDLDRVGIFGHSGGGFASTDAILRYPDFLRSRSPARGTTTTAATTSTGRRSIRA